MTKIEDKLENHEIAQTAFEHEVLQRLTRIETYRKADRWWTMVVAGISSSFVAVVITLVVAYLEKK